MRVEPVQKSNFHARFKMVWRKLNNRRRFSCFNKWEQVRFEIGRNIPGTTNFVSIYSSTHYLRQFHDFEMLPVKTFKLAELCNNNRDAPIRFSVWTIENKMINET